MMHDLSELQRYRPSQVANLLGISIASFWRLVRDKKLITKKLTPRTTTVSAKDLEAFIQSSREAK